MTGDLCAGGPWPTFCNLGTLAFFGFAPAFLLASLVVEWVRGRS